MDCGERPQRAAATGGKSVYIDVVRRRRGGLPRFRGRLCLFALQAERANC